MSIKLIFLGCLAVISTSLWAIDTGEFRGETKAKIEILQKQSDQANTKIDSLEKDIRDEYKTVTDRQNERISDLQNSFNTFLALLSTIIAIGGVGFPYMMYRQNTKAQEEAKKDIALWKIKTKSEFDKELNSFKDHAQGAKSELNISLEEAKKVESEIKNIQNELQNGKNIYQNTPKTDNSLSKIANKVREKPQSEYTFDDWNNLAFDAYSQNKLEDALFYWRKSIELKQSSEFTISQIHFNIAVTLRQLHRREEAIALFDQIIKTLKDISNDETQILRAKAFLNQGVTLGQFNRNKEAILIYDKLIQTYKETQNQSIQEERARAFVNRTEMQLILGIELDDSSDEIIKHYLNTNRKMRLGVSMLHVLKNVLQSDQTEQLKLLKDEFADINLAEWSWIELEEWANNLKDTKVKERVLVTIEQFKNWHMDSRSSRESQTK